MRQAAKPERAGRFVSEWCDWLELSTHDGSMKDSPTWSWFFFFFSLILEQMWNWSEQKRTCLLWFHNFTVYFLKLLIVFQMWWVKKKKITTKPKMTPAFPLDRADVGGAALTAELHNVAWNSIISVRVEQFTDSFCEDSCCAWIWLLFRLHLSYCLNLCCSFNLSFQTWGFDCIVSPLKPVLQISLRRNWMYNLLTGFSVKWYKTQKKTKHAWCMYVCLGALSFYEMVDHISGCFKRRIAQCGLFTLFFPGFYAHVFQKNNLNLYVDFSCWSSG